MADVKQSVLAETKDTLLEKYQAVMVLGGVGDALGFKNDEWEFNRDGLEIHEELNKLTKGQGIQAIKLAPPDWYVSDDTVMHIATAQGLVKYELGSPLINAMDAIAKAYANCYAELNLSSVAVDRAPGMQTLTALRQMGEDGKKWKEIAFSKSAGGCGAAMRSMCIGLAFPRSEQVDSLIAIAVESGCMTHHHPTGYLGAVAGALFTSYALQGVPVVAWGKKLLSEGLPKAKDYLKTTSRDIELHLQAFDYFIKSWEDYLKTRFIETGKGPARFPDTYGVVDRDAFYKKISYSGWGGSSGHDCPMIAYDALLGASICLGAPGGPVDHTHLFEEVCLRGVLHGGDSDSTGTMCCAWYGALYGFEGVPKNLFKGIEFYDELMKLGNALFQKCN